MDGREVLKGEAGVVVAVEERGKGLFCGGAASGFIPAGVEDDRLRIQGIGGFKGLAHRFLYMSLDHGERTVVPGGGGAGVDAVAVVGCVDDGRDAGCGDPVEVLTKRPPGEGDGLNLDELDCPLLVKSREQSKRLFVVEPQRAARFAGRQRYITPALSFRGRASSRMRAGERDLASGRSPANALER